MEGTALVERLGIERFESLGLAAGETIYATGGAAGGAWLRIRASVMRRQYAVPEQPECAVGAAVLVAAAYLGDFARAAKCSCASAARRSRPTAGGRYDEEFLNQGRTPSARLRVSIFKACDIRARRKRTQRGIARKIGRALG